jgi:protein gp37
MKTDTTAPSVGTRVLTSHANRRKPYSWQNKAADFMAKHGRRQRVFCASLADVFDNEVDPAWRTRFFRLIRATPHLDWLLLTKRIGNAARMVTDAHMEIGTPAGDSWDTLPQNAWLGATLVNREEMLRDGPKLKDTAARVRFWSCEPLLEDIGRIPFGLLPDWVIVGGESGRGARDFSIDVARDIVQQCQRAGVPVHVKQMGARPVQTDVDGLPRKVVYIATAGRDVAEWPADLRVQEFPAV